MRKKCLVGIGAIIISNITLYAQTATRTTALPDDLWAESQWISVSDAPVVAGTINDGDRAADGANWFVSDITNQQKVVSAIWMTTALGIYDLYVNGNLVGNEVLKPGFTHVDKTRRSLTYDITDMLDCSAEAINQLAVQVTPGWWGDKIVTPGGHQGMKGNKCAFRGILQLTFADGTTAKYGTGTETWRAAIAGPVKHAAIFDGEIYDARQPQGFADTSGFSIPEVNTEFAGVILPSHGAEIYHRDDLALAPIDIYVYSGVSNATDDEYGIINKRRTYTDGQPITLAPGEHLVVDFGQNCAAVPDMVFSAAEGTTLTCTVAELLNDGNGAKSRGMDGPEGSIHRTNLRIPDKGMYLQYTFGADDIPVNYRPMHTFFGYRYISITADGDITINRLRSIPVSSITREMESAHITTGNPLINQLISNTVWGQRSNYLSVPTDCPQRNERLGWTADTQVFAETGSFFADTRDFFNKWMTDMIDSQGEAGGYPSVAPAAQYGGELTRLGWSDAGVIVPWTIWKQFGDTSIVNLSWESMAKYLDHISATKYDHNSHLAENGNYQWGDWLSYEPLESCGGGAFSKDGPLPEAVEYWSLLSACYLVIDASMMHDMALATGRQADRYRSIAEETRAYIADRFLNSDGTFKTPILNTMQTPALFILKIGCLDSAAKAATVSRLYDNFKQHGDCLQTGFLGTSILMPTLTENGMTDQAYTLLFQRNNPSWLYSIDNGATTIWERWNSYMLDQGMGPKGMNSFNHYAYGCVCQWIWNTCAGIKSDASSPGFKHIIMEPIPDRRLGHLDAQYQSAAGEICSSWRYDGDDWVWTFTIPQGATASVKLPGQPTPTEYQAGTYTIRQRLD